MAGRAGRGKTPERVIELLKDAVDKSSQLAVANALKIGVATVNRYLDVDGNGGEPTRETLERIADYFGVTVAYLLGEELIGKHARELIYDLPVYLDELRKEGSISAAGRKKLDEMERRIAELVELTRALEHVEVVREMKKDRERVCGKSAKSVL